VFDLTVFTFNRLAGKEVNDLPGAFAAAPPKRPARGRERDRLVLLLQFEERGPVTQGAQPDVLERLATVFYSTRGTVTTALKAVVEQMNERLLARNLRVSRDGKPILGILGAAVLHDDMLYLAHSGPVHAYWIAREGVQHDFDPQSAGRGLGVSRTASMRFYRRQLKPGDLVLISAYPPATWSENALANSSTLSLDTLRRRLLTQAGDDLCFLMLRVNPGVGGLKVTSLQSGEARAAIPVAETETPRSPITFTYPPQPDEPAISVSESTGSPENKGVYLSGKRLTTDAPKKESILDRFRTLPIWTKKRKTGDHAKSPQAVQPGFSPIPKKQDSSSREHVATTESAQPWAPAVGTPEFQTRRTGRPTPAAPTLRVVKPGPLEAQARWTVGAILKGGKGFGQKAQDFISRLTARILPSQAERLPALSTGAMIFIAVVVPLVIVAVATTVYLQAGRGEQHRIFVAQARQMAAQAAVQADTVLMRVNYEAAIEYLDLAAEYGGSEEMLALRQQVNQGLDQLDGIRRVEFQPVIPGGLDDEIQIGAIVSSPTEDLYLLDKVSGSVIRMVYARPAYELDQRFFCGPGRYGTLIVGPLVDIAAVPPGNPFDAIVMGLDAFGNLLYCSLDQQNNTAFALIPPDAGWGNIQAIHFFGSTLHILDPRSNAVWRYEGTNLDFGIPPRFFFGNDVPDLAETLDLAIYQNDLFVIHKDGRLIYCTYSNISSSPTRCNDPYPYRMSWAGQDAQEVIRLNVRFDQIQVTQPPEPSLYFFDPEVPAVYQFSLGMNFIQQIQPVVNGDVRLPSTPATGFAVTSARRLLFAYGNQVYIGELR